MSTIQERVKRLIEYLEMNQASFAKSIDTHQSVLSRALKEGQTFGDALINKILLAYGNINRDWLIDGKGGILNKEYNSIVSEPTVSYGEKDSEGVTAISIIDRNSRSIEKMVEIADRNSRSIQQLVDSNMKLIELLHQNGIIISDETRKGGFDDSKEGKEGQSRNTRTTQAG